VFTLYNPPGAAVQPLSLVLVLGVYVTAGGGAAGGFTLHRSSDVADLDNLTNLLAVGNTCPVRFDHGLDATSVLAADDGGTYVPALDGAFFQAYSDTDSDKNVPVPLEFPLIIPPGYAIATRLQTASGDHRVSYRWARL
jgi:hypothetical protein